MKQTKLYISKIIKWAPGLNNDQDWENWKNNNTQINLSNETPALSFTTPLFRRRLSQLTKMTVQVVHELMESTGCGDIKQVFISKRGEINREFSVNQQICEDNSVLPAGFSLSVFNAAIAQATLACKLKSGYTVLFPSRTQKNGFKNALLCAFSGLLCNEEDSVMLIYADECIREEYKNILTDNEKNERPFAFAAVVSKTKKDIFYKELDLNAQNINTPEDFLKNYI